MIKIEHNSFSHIYDYALGVLSRFPKTSTQLIQKLGQKFPDAPPETINQVLTKLKDAALISDEKLAFEYAQTLLTKKYKSPWEIKNKLRNKGLADDLIESVLNQLLSAHSLEELAARAARKKQAQVAHLVKKEQYQKIFLFLQRRGFPIGIIRKVIREIGETSS